MELQAEDRGKALAGAGRSRRHVVLGALAVLLLCFVSLLTENAGELLPLTVTVEVGLAMACFGRALTGSGGRRGSMALGAGVLAWALGGIVWAVESPASTPSAADLFSLVFYPLAGVALLLLVGPELRQLKASIWLDAAVATLGTMAICSAFAFDTVGRIGGSPASVAVSLAYPIGDVALLALALGVAVIAPKQAARTMLFALGSALMALGGIVSLHQLSPGAHQAGAPLDLLWPAAMIAMTGSLWLRSPRGQRSSRVEKAPGMAIIALVLVACPVILVMSNFEQVNAVTLGLAGATVMVTAARMAMSLREQRALNDSRRHQAITDELTGLGNRRGLLDELDQALAALPEGVSQAGGLALLLIDLDHFKEINDSFGHQTGDALLRQIGPRIRQVVRRNDLVARMGGDEFAVVLYGADAYKATTVARRITTLLEQPIDVSTASLHVGASIGVALAPEHAGSAEDLIRCADIAMYRAKSERGSFDVYEAALDDEADRFALIEDLRVAMLNHSLALALPTGHRLAER